MPAKDYGTKHTCPKCGARFYDLRKPDPVCPRCGSSLAQAAPAPSERRRGRLAAVPKIIEPIAPEPSSEDEDEIEDVEEAEDDDDAS